MPSSRIESPLLRRTEPLRTALIAVAFWVLAVMALTSLRHLHLWGMPQVMGVVARATMACVVILVGLVGIRCLFVWRKSGVGDSVLSTLGGTPGVLLLGAVGSYLAIGVAGMDEAGWRGDTAGSVRYAVLCFGVLLAAVVGGRAMLERTGADRLLHGVLVVLIASCAIVLASPVLRDHGILAPYRIPFRLTGAFSGPNDAGLVGCMTAALAAALLTNGGPRTLGWLGLAAGVAASLGSASRAALAILVAVALVFLSINVRGRPKVLVAWAAAVLVGVGASAGVVFLSGGPSEWSVLRTLPVATQEGSLFREPSTSGLGADRAVLLATRDVLAGDARLNWSQELPIESWQGVAVGGSPERVTGLELYRAGLTGCIPPEYWQLSRLVNLNLGANRLVGTIPPPLGRLGRLVSLRLDRNRLTGPVPPALGKLTRLEMLSLGGNDLTGPIPPELGDLLKRPLPAGVGRDRQASLRVAGNDIDGVVASEHGPAQSWGIDERFNGVLADDRLLLWRLGLEEAMEAPLFGQGFGALKRLEGAPLTHSCVLPDPHNLYITLLGEAGIVPLLLFLSALVLLLRAQWAAPGSPARDAALAWVTVIALYSMTMSDTLGFGAYVFLAGLSVAIGAGAAPATDALRRHDR